MASKPEDKEQVLTITPELLSTMIASAVEKAVAAANKPYEEPAKKAQREADAKMLAEEIKRKQAEKEANIAACSHRRDDGTWNLHAQQYGDGKIGIVCGSCFGVFNPGHAHYNTLVTSGGIRPDHIASFTYTTTAN